MVLHCQMDCLADDICRIERKRARTIIRAGYREMMKYATVDQTVKDIFDDMLRKIIPQRRPRLTKKQAWEQSRLRDRAEIEGRV